jgi:hypothetical protein
MLTYMSIPRNIIRTKIDDGVLANIQPTRRGMRHSRVILATQGIARELMGPWTDQQTAIRMAALRAHLDRFLEGGLVDANYVKPLSPRNTEEVWEIKQINPSPSLRVLIRFIEKDAVVAFMIEERAPLGPKGSPQWKRVIRTTKARWTAVFGTYQPHSGIELDDYLSNASDNRFGFR